MSTLFPVGLSGELFDLLLKCVKETKRSLPSELLKDAEDHFLATEAAYKRNPLIDINTAMALIGCFRTVVSRWDTLPDHAKPYCLGMMRYFVIRDDELKDLSSPIGFDDDVEVVNACLKLACLDELCFNPGEC